MGPTQDLLDCKDYTPLHWACYNGKFSLVLNSTIQ